VLRREFLARGRPPAPQLEAVRQEGARNEKRLKMLLFIVLGLIFVTAIALVYGNRQWQSATEAMQTKLEVASGPLVVETYYSEELDDLPAPVQCFFRSVLEDGQPVIEAVRLEQAGTFNMDESADQWRPFTADQYVVTRPPGFLWDARIAMLPGISVRVHDAYVKREGILHASLFGLITMAEMRGTPEAAEGEFMRFFAESAWYPTALLPSQSVHWEAVDDTSAQATLRDGENSVSMLFRFDRNGLIESVRAKTRGRAVGDEIIPTPWEGRWSNYERVDGILVPLEGEVYWVLPEGPKPYWRGRITNISFEFTE
jgi:hypothetical protein